MVDDPSSANHGRIMGALVDKDAQDYSRSCGEWDGTKSCLECRDWVGTAIEVIKYSGEAITLKDKAP